MKDVSGTMVSFLSPLPYTVAYDLVPLGGLYLPNTSKTANLTRSTPHLGTFRHRRNGHRLEPRAPAHLTETPTQQ